MHALKQILCNLFFFFIYKKLKFYFSNFDDIYAEESNESEIITINL